MSNADTARGFWPLRTRTGGGLPSTIEVSVDSNNSVAIGIGDLVVRESDGNCTRGGSGGAATSTDLAQLVGVVMGAKDSNKKALKYLPASTAGFLEVMPVENVIFGIQCDGSLVATDIGVVRALVYNNTTPVDTLTGRSTFEVSYTTATNPAVKVLDKIKTPGNDWGTNVDVEVMFVLDGLTSGTGI